MAGYRGSLYEKISKLEKNSLKDKDIDSDDLDLQLKRYRVGRYIDDSKKRKELSIWACWLVSIYLVLIFVVLMFNSFLFKLSDVVLSVLLGTTTLNVLGLMYIVLHGFFDSKEKYHDFLTPPF